jgi:GAF domain-containing protein
VPSAPYSALAAAFLPDGKYAPGETLKHLTSAFMEMSDLYGSFGTDQEAAFTHVLQYMKNVFDVEGGVVAIRDRDSASGRLLVRAEFGPRCEGMEGRSLRLGEGAVGACGLRGSPLNIRDLRQEPGLDRCLFREPEDDVGPVLCVPVEADDLVQGVLMVHNPPGAVPFTDSQVHILSHVGSTLGAYLLACRAEEAARRGAKPGRSPQNR